MSPVVLALKTLWMSALDGPSRKFRFEPSDPIELDCVYCSVAGSDPHDIGGYGVMCYVCGLDWHVTCAEATLDFAKGAPPEVAKRFTAFELACGGLPAWLVHGSMGLCSFCAAMVRR